MNRTILRCLFVLVTIAAAPSVYAQEWEPLHGPNGGVVLAILRSGTDVLLGSTDRVFISTDQGGTWNNRSEGIVGVQAAALARDSAGRLYAGVDQIYGPSGIFRSTDEGATWEPVIKGLRRDRGVLAIAAYDANTICAGLRAGDIVRSIDHGGTWQSTDALEADGTKITGLYTYEIRVGPGGAMFAETGNGILRSTDAGSSWRMVRATPSGASYTQMMIASGETPAVYASERGVIERSTDGGITWEPFARPPINVAAFAITPTGTFLGARNDSLVRSVDSGRTWRPAFVDTYVARFNAVDMTAAGEILLGTNQGIYRSRDDGRTWESLNAELVASNVGALAADSSGTLFALALEQGVFRSTNGGGTWKNLGPPGGGPLPAHVYASTIASGGSGFVYVIGGDSMYVSRDNGDTWANHTVDRGVIGGDILAAPGGLTLAEARGVGFDYSGIARSADYGASWELLNSRPVGSRFRFQRLANGHIFAAVDVGIRFSLDSGATWERRRDTRPDGFRTYDLVLARSGALLAANRYGLYRTANEGVAWDSLGRPFPMDSVRDMYALRDGDVMAIVSGRLQRSGDDGANWNALDVNGHGVGAVVEDADGDLFVGTLGRGVLRRTSTSAVEPGPAARTGAVLSRLSAVARGARVEVQFLGPPDADAHVALFDLAGAEIAAVTVHTSAEGTETASLPVERIAVGTYLCRVQCGSFVATCGVVSMR